MRWRRWNKILKLDADWEPHCVNVIFLHTIVDQYCGGGLVGNNGSIGWIAIPSRIDNRGIRDDRKKWGIHSRVEFFDLGQDVAKDRISGDDHVGAKLLHQTMNGVDELGEEGTHALDHAGLAEHLKNDFPHARVMIDRQSVAMLHKAIY